MDGTLASLVRPGQVTTGPVWDALAAPLVALSPRRLKSLLILGLGGGSVARLARALAPEVAIVGVEKDREVLDVARRDLGLDHQRLELVVDDALGFLERDRRRFDAVVEDLFVGSVRRLRKPEWLLDRYELVKRRVARGGILAANTIHETPRVARILRAWPGTLVSLNVDAHYNRILALGPRALEAHALRRTLRSHPILSRAAHAFALRTLRP